MRISAVIVNYNTRDILKDCVENLFGTGIDLQIVVVDNGSTDGSVEMTKETFGDKVHLIETENNGLAAGLNLGTRVVEGKYIMYLGTDAFPDSTALNGLVDYFENNPKVGAATPKLVLRDGSPDIDAHRGFPTPWAALTHFSKLNKLFPNSKIFNQYFLGWKDLNTEHEVDLCITHFLFCRKSVIDKVGAWDETFFVYGEDVDYCYRIKQAGYKIMYLPQWEVLHYKGVTVGRKESSDIKTKANQSKENVTRMKTESTRAMEIFYKKHYSNLYPAIITIPILFGIKVLGRFRARM